MFSGLVGALGKVRTLARAGQGARIEVACELSGEPIAAGESIAIAGVCVTARPAAGGFAADLSPETLHRTTLGSARAGTTVNLERALRPSDRLGGHFVLGHVDAAVSVLQVREQRPFRIVRLELPGALASEVAEKGSLALDGVSLTVAVLGEGWLEVALIPATLSATTLGSLAPGQRVNLETDVLAKYVRRTLRGGRESLAETLAGFLDAPS